MEKKFQVFLFQKNFAHSFPSNLLSIVVHKLILLKIAWIQMDLKSLIICWFIHGGKLQSYNYLFEKFWFFDDFFSL